MAILCWAAKNSLRGTCGISGSLVFSYQRCKTSVFIASVSAEFRRSGVSEPWNAAYVKLATTWYSPQSNFLCQRCIIPVTAA